jgi:dTDP-4-dehydrorhamnose reductase
MRILVTGATGVLGPYLVECLGREHEVVAAARSGAGVAFDLADPEETLSRAADVAPEAIVHAGAMTDVDKCELDPDAAYRVNAMGTWALALAARKCSALMMYVSTDYVFDGQKGEPYDEFDPPNPQCHYSRSKLAGEEITRRLVPEHYIVRPAWVFGRKRRGFVWTALDAIAKGEGFFAIVDQRSSPTYAADAAEVMAEILESGRFGTYHVTNKGACTRLQVAEHIASRLGKSPVIQQRTLAEWNPPARRGKNTALRHLSLQMQGRDDIRGWKEALDAFLEEIG